MSIRLVRLAIAAAVLVTGTGCAPATPPPTTTSTPVVTTTPTATAVQTQSEIVYFPRDSSRGFRLGREQREVQQADPLLGILETMIEGPVDVDYLSGWAEGTRVLSATTAGSVTTVDLSGEARTTTLGSEAAMAQADQLLWTVTELVGADSAVDLMIEGQPAGDLWGVLRWDGPRRRGDPLTARVLVSIDAPLDGSAVSSPVVVTGNANAYEATVPWRVLNEAGAVVEEGFTNTLAGQEFADYRFEVELDPGRYTIEIRETGPTGEGRPGDTDTRTVVVEGT